MNIRPGTFWYKASVKTLSGVLAKVIKPEPAIMYDYQVTVSETEFVRSLNDKSSENDDEIRPIFWNDVK